MAVPRFVILEHDHPHRHWDFMLESSSVLRTWRLAHPPETAAAIPADALGDHRMAYLDYEGPVSGGRGTVARWDSGTFTWVADGPKEVIVDLEGRRFRGRVSVRQNLTECWEATFQPWNPDA